MDQAGYRAGARPDVYDPSHRVRCCDACGAGFVVGESERVHACPSCPHAQELPEGRDVSVTVSPAGNESERLAHLATQLDHQWLIPKSMVRFGGNVLEEEIGEARAVWARTRQRLEENPEDPDAALELMCVTFALHGALPAGTRAERMARRALAESSAEAVLDPAMRQKILYNLVIGAVRSGEHDHARAWLRRLDSRSRSLDADSSYRVVAAALATANQDHMEVLKILGRESSEIPIHTSSRVLSAVLRATALEKLGNLAAAVECLYAEVLRRHSALANISELASGFPAEWLLCERSLPLVIERDKGRLADNVPARNQPAVILGSFAVGVVGIAIGVLEGTPSLLAGLGALALGALAALFWVRDFRRRVQIVRGTVAVRGRILAMKSVGGGVYELEVTVERDDLPDERVTTLQPLNAQIQKMSLEGCSFDALWNPAYPSLFPRITINVSGDSVERAKRAS